jgi:gamma-glutamyl-gamma-aminobutyrate hydrolase PuuD
MSVIAVTLQCEVDNAGKARDILDPRWPSFLEQAGLSIVEVPNETGAVQRILDGESLSGVLLTGGCNLSRYGGRSPQRDAVELRLFVAALERNLPVLGVGRGMQVIQNHFGVPLKRVQGHTHHWGTTESVPALSVWSRAEDGVVKAIRHLRLPILGIMWHPELADPFAQTDRSLFQEFFQAGHERGTEVSNRASGVPGS